MTKLDFIQKRSHIILSGRAKLKKNWTFLVNFFPEKKFHFLIKE